MNYLIFCSSEIGGLPFRFSRTLNKNGFTTYYISLSGKKKGHDTSSFHYGKEKFEWDISNHFFYLNLFPHRLDQLFYNPYFIISKISYIVKKYNINGIFCTGIKSYLFSHAGLNYHYWSYGSDLDKFCFNYPYLIKNTFLSKIEMYLYNKIIKVNAVNSIKNSEKIMIAPYQETYLEKISPDKKTFFLPHLIDSSSPETLFPKKQTVTFMKLKEYSCDELFFSSTRHEWGGKLKEQDDNKGNNIIIDSFFEYLKLQPNKIAKLLLIEKGSDVPLSKQLISDLNISDHVIWLPELPRPQLEDFYLAAKVAFGQFHTPVLTNSCIEPLAAATPVISYFGNNEIKTAYYQTLPPIFNSKEAIIIADFIYNISCRPNRYTQLQLDSFEWVNRNCSENSFVQSFTNLFDS